MLVRRRIALPALLCAALALTGCGEAGPVDDGTYSSLEAGAPEILADLGVALVSLERPAAASPQDVVDALSEQNLEGLTYAVGPVEGLALDPEKVAGLLGLAGNASMPDVGSGTGRYVVLSFDRLESAVVFVQRDPEIFDDAELEADRAAYFSGNLVAYYAPSDSADATDRFRSALDALAGAWEPGS